MGTFTKEEVERLMDKVGILDSMSPCTFLYRNKDEDYFNNILRNDGIMKPYMKDNSGDPRNPINGRIVGLFFMASVHAGEPFSHSPFGPRRCLIPTRGLVNPLIHNLYFSDYFCMRGINHYVTLVVTKKGSWIDEFCQSRLPLLDMYRNNFFRCNPITNQFLVNTYRQSLQVEICYTENVDIRSATFETVPIVGKGSSTPGGLPKNPRCSICNLR